MSNINDELAAILETRLDALEAEHADLLDLLSELHRHEEEHSRRFEDKTRWMRSAKRELDEILREVEGPNPPRGTRTKPKQ